jgi:hypothetical protein
VTITLTKVDDDQRVVDGITLEQRTPDRLFYVHDGQHAVRFERSGSGWQVVTSTGRGRSYEESTEPVAYDTLTIAVQATRRDFWHPTSMPATKTGRAVNGHLYEYDVRDRHTDGTLSTSSWNARHHEDCKCEGDFYDW